LININVTLLIQLVNFLILMYLLNRLLFQPMLRILEERRERTEGRQEQAGRVDAEAEAVLAEYEKRILEAKTEADRVRADLIRKGEAERQKLLDAAGAEAEKTLAEIRARVRGEADEARRALQGEADRLAADAAERILGRAF
jgi:F-type H+-transporting ATPase subunit b